MPLRNDAGNPEEPEKSGDHCFVSPAGSSCSDVQRWETSCQGQSSPVFNEDHFNLRDRLPILINAERLPRPERPSTDQISETFNPRMLYMWPSQPEGGSLSEAQSSLSSDQVQRRYSPGAFQQTSDPLDTSARRPASPNEASSPTARFSPLAESLYQKAPFRRPYHPEASSHHSRSDVHWGQSSGEAGQLSTVEFARLIHQPSGAPEGDAFLRRTRQDQRGSDASATSPAGSRQVWTDAEIGLYQPPERPDHLDPGPSSSRRSERSVAGPPEELLGPSISSEAAESHTSGTLKDTLRALPGGEDWHQKWSAFYQRESTSKFSKGEKKEAVNIYRQAARLKARSMVQYARKNFSIGQKELSAKKYRTTHAIYEHVCVALGGQGKTISQETFEEGFRKWEAEDKERESEVEKLFAGWQEENGRSVTGPSEPGERSGDAHIPSRPKSPWMTREEVEEMGQEKFLHLLLEICERQNRMPLMNEDTQAWHFVDGGDENRPGIRTQRAFGDKHGFIGKNISRVHLGERASTGGFSRHEGVPPLKSRYE